MSRFSRRLDDAKGRRKGRPSRAPKATMPESWRRARAQSEWAQIAQIGPPDGIGPAPCFDANTEAGDSRHDTDGRS